MGDSVADSSSLSIGGDGGGAVGASVSEADEEVRPRKMARVHYDDNGDGNDVVKSYDPTIEGRRGDDNPSAMQLSESAEEDKRKRMEKLREELNMEDAADAPVKKIQTLDDVTSMEPDEAIAALMGIQQFGSTKGKKVLDNHVGPAKGATSSKKERKYRQYMNRKGGFNRPLDKI